MPPILCPVSYPDLHMQDLSRTYKFRAYVHITATLQPYVVATERYRILSQKARYNCNYECSDNTEMELSFWSCKNQYVIRAPYCQIVIAREIQGTEVSSRES